MNRLTKSLAFTALAFGFIVIGMAILVARYAVFPPWYKPADEKNGFPACNHYQQKTYVYCKDPLAALGFEFKSFEFVHEQGLPLAGVSGWFVPASAAKGTVVLVHGGGADRRAMTRHVTYLRAAGFHSLVIDCQNHGMAQNDGKGIAFGWREGSSVLAALDWAKQEKLPRPYVAFGTSLGAFSSMVAAAFDQDKLIDGLILEGSFVSAREMVLDFPLLQWVPRALKRASVWFVGLWIGKPLSELDFRELGKRVTAPALILHGEKDLFIPSSSAAAVREALASKEKEVWVAPGAGHEDLWNTNKADYEKRVLGFLEKRLETRD